MRKSVRHAAVLLSSICLAAVLSAGCQEQKETPAEAVKPAEPVAAVRQTEPVQPASPASSLSPGHPAAPAPDPKSLPRVSLSEIEVGESEDGAVTRITVTGGGAFASNVIRKEDPERIILLIHNAEAGELAGSIEVNNGTVGRIEVAQLESGQGPAVRVTVGLAGESEFRIVPAENALAVDLRRPQTGIGPGKAVSREGAKNAK